MKQMEIGSMSTTKICTKCNTEKELDYFHRNKGGKYGTHNQCKECRKLYRGDWHIRYKDTRHRDTTYKYQYGIGLDDVDSMLKDQGYLCKICSKPVHYNNRTGCVDHNHQSGKVRGILCYTCNSALGKFKDSEELLTKAINYLKENN